MEVLRVEDANAWRGVVEDSVQADFYFLPEYHRLAARRGEGAPHLFVHREGPHFIALPLLLRSVHEVSGLEVAGRGWYDATSVYGYAGPLSSSGDLPAGMAERFQAGLRRALSELRVVTVFSRLHPLIPQQSVLRGLGELRPSGKTVSIDLTLPPEVQRARYEGGHKRAVNKLRRLGVECVLDHDLTHFADFVSLYHETMRRVDATEGYFFDESYFRALTAEMPETVHLFVALVEGRVASGGLFTLCDGIVQYHLSGTRDDALKLAPMKLILDTVRLWATERGMRTFHLGGGQGGSEDSLFRFKAGFSDRLHDFTTWRWVVDPEVVATLQEHRDGWNRAHGVACLSPGYFPLYRCPSVREDGAA